MDARLESFPDIIAHLAASYTVRPLAPFTVELEEVGPDRTRIHVELMEGRGQRWLVASAFVCAERDVNASGALLYNASLCLGSLALDAGALWMRAALPLPGLTAASLDEIVSYLTVEVAHIVRIRVGGASVAALFENLVD